MKKLSILAFLLFQSYLPQAFAANYEIDSAHTYPSFRVLHLGFSTMQGLFKETTGKMTYDPANQSATVSIVVNTASIETGHKKRDDHLRSADFFNAVEFPEMRFDSTSIEWNGDTISSITGNLELLGVTKSVTLAITRSHCGSHPFNKKHVCGFDASTSIQRSDFGMVYGSPAIGDQIDITIELEAVRL